MDKNNGGQAFPSRRDNPLPGGGCYRDDIPGMTLRDYFAAKAMQGFLSCGDYQSPFMGTPKSRPMDQWVCEAAYDYADAMLAARGES